MAELKDYVVLNRKGFPDDVAKKKFQFEHKGVPQKAGDILKLDPRAMATLELLGMGRIKLAEEKPVVKVDTEEKPEKGKK